MIQRIIDGFTAVAWVVFVFMTALQVFLRYVMGSALFWADELSRFCLVWFVFLGALTLSIEDDHIRVGFLAERFSRGKGKLVLDLIRRSVEMLFTAIIVYGSWETLPLITHTKTPAIRMPIWLWYLAATVASAGIFFCSAKQWCVSLRGLLRGSPEQDSLTVSGN